MRHGVWWCCAWESPKFHTTSFALRPILGSVKGHRTRLTCEARLASFRPLNGVDPRATNCAAISWGAWYAAGLRGESQPIEPDPGHAGGGRDASAASERNATLELPAIAADILERLRQRRPRVHCITNAVAQNFTANMLLAAGAVPSMTIAQKEVGRLPRAPTRS